MAPAASPSAPGTSGASRAPGAHVAADPTLLALVPQAGITLTYDPATTAGVAADPSLAASASQLAIGLATPAATASSAASAGPGGDLAVVSVIRLRDPSVDETWFRDWRDSYDDASCANAGGVVRRAETVVGQSTVYIGSCAGGSFTYHARVDGGSAVISLTSIGPANLGQMIMAGLAG
jgi:hypothetical protein